MQTAEVKRTFDKESILKQAITTLSTIFVIMLPISIEGMRNPNKMPVGKNRSRAGRCGHSGTKRFPPSFFFFFFLKTGSVFITELPFVHQWIK